jgi:4-hydroxy-tetrahydrodipicolinate reductase
VTAVPIRLGLVGALGRMGLAIAQAAARRADLRVAAAIERPDHTDLGADLAARAGAGPAGVIVGADLARCLGGVDVVVDLSHVSAAARVADAAAAAGVALLSGTTGLNDAALEAIARAAASVPVLQTANLSPGAAVLADLVRRATAALGDDYDVEIVELHHRHKADAPSGTALMLAAEVSTGRGRITPSELCFGRSGRTGERPTGQIGIHAVRGGSVFGEHRVVLAGPHERLEIAHVAESRALFAEGALRAALFLARARPGRYTMSDVLAAP